MLRKLAVLFTFLPGFVPRAALACACCADPGTRFQEVSELGAWEISEIAALAPTSPARLYQSACGLDCVGGITDPQTAYDVAMEVTETGLAFVLSDGRGPRGALTFPWPETYTWFAVDTALDGKGDPQVYTELRFRGALAATGDFAQDGPVAAELVLSGFGNVCITRQSFDGWMLSVSDDSAQFRLFGTLSER